MHGASASAGGADEASALLAAAETVGRPSRRRRSYATRLARGEIVSFRVFGAMVFFAAGAVALVMNVTVEKVAESPVSHNWIQSLASSADPRAAQVLAAGLAAPDDGANGSTEPSSTARASSRRPAPPGRARRASPS